MIERTVGEGFSSRVGGKPRYVGKSERAALEVEAVRNIVPTGRAVHAQVPGSYEGWCGVNRKLGRAGTSYICSDWRLVTCKRCLKKRPCMMCGLRREGMVTRGKAVWCAKCDAGGPEARAEHRERQAAFERKLLRRVTPAQRRAEREAAREAKLAAKIRVRQWDDPHHPLNRGAS